MCKRSLYISALILFFVAIPAFANPTSLLAFPETKMMILMFILSKTVILAILLAFQGFRWFRIISFWPAVSFATFITSYLFVIIWMVITFEIDMNIDGSISDAFVMFSVVISFMISVVLIIFVDAWGMQFICKPDIAKIKPCTNLTRKKATGLSLITNLSSLGLGFISGFFLF